MKNKQLIASITMFVAAQGAFAQQTDFVTPDANLVSAKTREQVKAELKQAQADGTHYAANPYNAHPTPHFVSAKTREQVKAELKQAQADGTHYAANPYGINPTANFVSTKTREQVNAELKQAQANGSLAAQSRENYAH